MGGPLERPVGGPLEPLERLQWGGATGERPVDLLIDKSHVEMFDCVDPASTSRVLVTSRMSGIVVAAPEVPLGRPSGNIRQSSNQQGN